MLLSGSTGSGKTTVLRALADFIPKHERVISCEDTLELRLNLPNCIAGESAAGKKFEGGLPAMIETALRQRPDRIFVGEIRSAEAASAFLQAINTGHTGSATSLHANSCEDAISRVQYLIASEGLLDYDLAGRQARSGVDFMIHLKRFPVGKRIAEIAEMVGDEVVPVFTYNSELDTQVSV